MLLVIVTLMCFPVILVWHFNTLNELHGQSTEMLIHIQEPKDRLYQRSDFTQYLRTDLGGIL